MVMPGNALYYNLWKCSFIHLSFSFSLNSFSQVIEPSATGNEIIDRCFANYSLVISIVLLHLLGWLVQAVAFENLFPTIWYPVRSGMKFGFQDFIKKMLTRVLHQSSILRKYLFTTLNKYEPYENVFTVVLFFW